LDEYKLANPSFPGTSYSSPFAAGLAALWILRQPLGDFLNWIGDRQAVITSIQQFGAWDLSCCFSSSSCKCSWQSSPGMPHDRGGYVFGFRVGLLIALSSTILGSQIAFLIARNLGRPVVDRLASPEAIRRWERLAAPGASIFLFACAAFFPQ
jgi:hypothetical protein